MTRRLLLLAVVFAALAPAARADTPPTLTQLPGLNACISQFGTDPARDSQQVCTVGSGLGDPSAGAISPDGRNVYVTGFDDTLSMMRRDPATGALTPLGCFSDVPENRTCTPARELRLAEAVVVSPDGQNVYVGGDGGTGGIAVFDRDPATGLLAQPLGTSGCVMENNSTDGCVPAKEVGESVGLAMSPDGKSLYSTDERGGIAVLRRAADGSLSQSTAPGTGCISEDGTDEGQTSNPMPCADGKAMNGPFGVAVSPNGRQVYAADESTGGVAVLERDTTTGELSQSTGMNGCISEGGRDGNTQNACTPGIGLEGAGTILVTPDGGQVVVASFFSNGLGLLDRDPNTGDLTQKPGTAGCITEDGRDGVETPPNVCSIGRNLVEASGLATNQDGTKLYVGSSVFSGLASLASTRGIVVQPAVHASGGVALFDRDPASGSLQQPAGAAGCVNEVGGPFNPSVKDACAGGIALQGLVGLVTSPDDGNLYAVSADSQAVAEFGPPLPVPPVAPPAHDTTAPSVSRFTLTHRVFAVAQAATPVSARVRGTAFRFRLSEQSAVKIAIKRALPGRRVGKRCVKPSAHNRHGHACRRFVAAGTLRRSEKAGAVSDKFSGRIGKRALKPGRYRATITATDAAGNVSKARSASFRIIR